MAERKLKDLRIGDKMWLYDFTDTTPITVVKKKREAELMTITLKWDDEVFDCFGPALGWTCVCYSMKWKLERIFTSSYDMAHEREKRKKRIIQFIDNTKKFIQENEEICRKALEIEEHYNK